MFHYRTLASKDHIRLLMLHPGKRDDPVTCSLKEVPIREAEGRYEGISYVWGTSRDSIDIDVDGRQLRIHKNLHDAFLVLRYPSEPRVVAWADAVCIGQADHNEKGDQVKKMAEIFQKATRVLCWPGHDNDVAAGSCFDFVKDATHQLACQWQSH